MVHARYGHQANWCVGLATNVSSTSLLLTLAIAGLSVALLAALEFCNNLCSLLFSLAIS